MGRGLDLPGSFCKQGCTRHNDDCGTLVASARACRESGGLAPDHVSDRKAWKQGARMMNFRIRGLPASDFTHLFAMADDDLAAAGGVRRIADGNYPCRVSLADS